MSQDPYKFINAKFNSLTASETGFEALLAKQPYIVDDDVWSGFVTRFALIRQFQQITLNLFFGSLAGELDPRLAELFFRDLPGSFGRSFHESLPKQLRT